MRFAWHSWWVFSLVMMLANTAYAKPRLVILGLEVVGKNSLDTANVANKFTQTVKDVASSTEGDFTVDTGPSKDLLELKLLYDCDERRRCMADIGRKQKADLLLYGKLEKKRNGYQISLRLLAVEKAEMIATVTDLMTSENEMVELAQTMVNRILTTNQAGALTVSANVDSGSVMVDGKIVTSLANGSASVADMAPGEHRVRIESPGYEPWEETVSVAAGGSHAVEASLVEVPSAPPPRAESGGIPGWKIGFAASASLTAIAGTMWAIEGLKVRGSLKDEQRDAVSNYNMLVPPEQQFGRNVDACDQAKTVSGESEEVQAAAARVVQKCDEGFKHAKYANWAAIATGVGALASGYLFYRAFIKDDDSTAERRSARKNRKHRSKERWGQIVGVTPAISPNYVGAGMVIEF